MNARAPCSNLALPELSSIHHAAYHKAPAERASKCMFGGIDEVRDDEMGRGDPHQKFAFVKVIADVAGVDFVVHAPILVLD